MCLEGFLVSRKHHRFSHFKVKKLLILLESALFNANQYFSNSPPSPWLILVYSLQWCFTLTCQSAVLTSKRREEHCLARLILQTAEVTTHADRAVAWSVEQHNGISLHQNTALWLYIMYINTLWLSMHKGVIHPDALLSALINARCFSWDPATLQLTPVQQHHGEDAACAL